MNLNINDYFECDDKKYLVLHKNKNEITVVIQTPRDILIQIKDKNFFDKPNMKKKINNPFCNIKNLVNLLEGLQKNGEILFLGYVDYYNGVHSIEKRTSHHNYQLLFQMKNKYFSLMISDTPAYELLTDYYYTATWGYNLNSKEIVSLTEIEGITEDTIGFSKKYTVIKEPLSITKEKKSLCLNSMIKIYTDLRQKQVEILNKNRNAFVLEDKQDFISRF